MQKQGKIGISENKANLTMASSTAVYENAPKNKDMIQVSSHPHAVTLTCLG